jgi:hypothetical protein
MDSVMTPAAHRAAGVNGNEKPLPLDLSHHYSVVTKRRLPSQIKAAYKFFQIPGILNIAGGVSCWSSASSLLSSIHLLNPTVYRPSQCRLLPLRHAGSPGSEARAMDSFA